MPDTSNILLRDWPKENVIPMLDETHLGARLDAKLSTKPSWNDNPTPRCHIDGIHSSSLLKNVSESHEFEYFLGAPSARLKHRNGESDKPYSAALELLCLTLLRKSLGFGKLYGS